MYFRLLGANSLHVKAENERFTAAGSRCCQNLKYENFTSSFGRLRQKMALKRVLHVQHDYFPSFNQLNHIFSALSLSLPLSSSNLKLPFMKLRRTGRNLFSAIPLFSSRGLRMRLLVISASFSKRVYMRTVQILFARTIYQASLSKRD